jgi:hypothetical protein
MTDERPPEISRRVLDRVRAETFAALPPRLAATTHLSLVERPYPAGHVLRLVDRRIEVPEDSIVAFVDEMPGANFGHPCRYRFHSVDTGRLIREVEALFPPEVSDPGIPIDTFHAPLVTMLQKPELYATIDLSKFGLWPWLKADDNRFALLFSSQISNRRHIEDLELAWRVLVNRFGFPESNVYVLCYDGTIGSTDFSGADMATWIGDGTAYQMQVTDSATKANLQTTLDTISSRMNDESLLFVHTNNHGAPDGLCIDNSSILMPSEWGTMLDGMRAFGTLVVTMEQCYSGAFEQPTLDHSRAARTSFASAVPADKVSAGAAHFDPWAQIWFESVNGSTAYGASLPHNPDASGNGRVSAKEAFNYSDAYDTASYDDPQYGDSPSGCGAGIYLSKPPTLAEIIAEITKRYVAIDRTFRHGPPLPDPAPDWASDLLPTLALAESLQARMEALPLREPRAIPIETPAPVNR